MVNLLRRRVVNLNRHHMVSLIRRKVVNLTGVCTTTTSLGSYFTYLYNYRYDQLNRLVDMDTYRGFNATTNSWSGMDGVFYHREHYTYDANGNILRASRNGNLSANQLMDSLHYYYTPGTNRLEYIDDSATTVYGINVDIKDQSPGNYQYDAIGNLVSSVNRPISGIKWNVYGKIVDIQKTAVGNATANYIYYNYDPSGNRIGQVTRHNSGINTIYRYTWYVRDAQGNVIAVYKVADTKTVSSGTLQLAEHHMYGSSRLGIINRDIDADQAKHSADNSNNNLGEAFLINFTRGNKFFELSNHLGNVLSTITDNKLPTPVQNNPLLIASYSADLVTAVDYSPFGMTLPGRVYNNHWRRYRYGFNGKEIDNEVQGEYNELDYGMRVYDPRVGRFLSVDPLQKKYPELTPYQFASNSPIDGTDLDGRERVDQRIFQDKDGNTQLQTTATGPASRRYFHSFWEVSKVPPHYRVEFNQQHYWFAASTDAASINLKHDGRLYIPIYSLDQYERFVQNPGSSGLVSEEQAQKAESKRIVYEGMEMALQALIAESPGMLSAMRRGPKIKSTPSAQINEQTTAAHSGNNSATQSNRPTWQESEADILTSDYQPQVPFKNGIQLPPNSKPRGSVRPEGYKPGASLEVKNYSLTTEKGIQSMIRNVVKQVQQRQSNLPANTVQNITLDVRGQNLNAKQLMDIRSRLMTQTGSKNINVNFRTD